jgi:hypothetical protein
MNFCQKIITDLRPHNYEELNIEEFRFDHDAVEIFCDANYQNPSNPYGLS